MNRPYRAAVAAAVCLILMSGCSRMLENDYRAISAHTDAAPSPLPDSGAQVVSTYADLKSAILFLVRTGSSEGTVRLRNYVGDAEADVQKACYAVYRGEPIGVYALDFLSHTLTPILTDYDVTVRLTYRRTYEQIKAVEYISGPSAFKLRFEKLLSDFGTALTLETNYYQESEYDFQALLDKQYYDNPLHAQGRPELSVNLYPESSGLRRVIELNLYYPNTLNALRLNVERSQDSVTEMLSGLEEEREPYLAFELYNRLAANCVFDWELYYSTLEGNQANSTVYDALYGGRALPEGIALAYKALCDDAGLECVVVRGRRSSPQSASGNHFWNLVSIDGDWYHVDLSADMMNDQLTYRTFLLDDSLMSLEYGWDTAAYPPAYGALTLDVLEVAVIEEETMPDNPESETGE